MVTAVAVFGRDKHGFELQMELAKVNGLNEGISNAGAIIQSLWGSATPGKGPSGGIAFAMLYTGPPAAAITTAAHADALQQVYLPLHPLPDSPCSHDSDLLVKARPGVLSPALLQPSSAWAVAGAAGGAEHTTRRPSRCRYAALAANRLSADRRQRCSKVEHTTSM